MAAHASTGIVSEPSIVQKVAYIFSAPDEEEDGANGPEVTPTRRSGGRGQKHRARHDEDRRSAKKRRTADDANDVDNGLSGGEDALSAFPPLLQGRETPAAVALRRQLYTSTWARLEGRIQKVVQEFNWVTLRAVMDFIQKPVLTKLPAAFIVLGPAATADSLLFPQLAAELAESIPAATAGSSRPPVRRLIRFRAAEALNLRAALKTIVQEVTAATGADDDIAAAQEGYKYLSYDLEAVAAALPPASSDASWSRIVIAFEDSEAFDALLLADLIAFLHSWLDRIPFVLLFGVATSVDLFQARLSKQAAHRLAAAQFDVAPSSAVLDRLVERAVATADTPLRLGPSLLRSLLERQDEQVTGVSVFVNSVKYAYMCYFYGNPLSVLLLNQAGRDDDGADGDERRKAEASTLDGLLDSPDYQAAIRQLPSFRRHVEGLVAAGQLDAARQLLDDRDGRPLQQAVRGQLQYQRRWTERLLRAVHVAMSSGVFAGQSFSTLYLCALRGRVPDDDTPTPSASSSSLAAALTHAIRRMSAPDLESLIRRLTSALFAGNHGDVPGVGADPEKLGDASEKDWQALPSRLDAILPQLVALQEKVQSTHAASQRRNKLLVMQGVSEGGSGSAAPPPLRSKYTAQAKVLRTTVVAQKVQLSRDPRALTDEDHEFTVLVDKVVDLVAAAVDVEGVEDDEAGPAGGGGGGAGGSGLWLQEVWLFDARTPYRDVFLPKPGVVVERALARPYDYLACACCRPERARHGKDEEAAAEATPGSSIRSTLPATAILYQLYLEAGPLINVADLWDAFLAVVVGDREDAAGAGPGAGTEDGTEGGRTGGKKKNAEAASTEEQENDDNDAADDDSQERRHLVQFYQALAEMKALGYVKATRRKVDHVAKVKWL